ncbi:hypothetical protein BJ166DRAFT_229356 [Pestalotiopsis sp. NC0098]|nr:hypothetical protein BJ166DRAFT_229356 [Pestalotiopsis sp. NC0098]
MARVCLHVALSARTVLGACVCMRTSPHSTEPESKVHMSLVESPKGGWCRKTGASDSVNLSSCRCRSKRIASKHADRPALCLDSSLAGFNMRPRATWARLSWGKLSKILTLSSVPEESPWLYCNQYYN